MKYTAEECAIAMCNASFVTHFQVACEQAGGGGWDAMKGDTLEQVMRTLARNGLRVTYDRKYHMDSYRTPAVLMAPAIAFLPSAPAIAFLPSAPISA